MAARTFDRSRLRLGIVVAVIVGALAFLVMQGLGGATTYFYNADEVDERRGDLVGESIRLQGTVVGEPEAQETTDGDDALLFRVEYDCAGVDVVHRGDPPELFKPGIPVVLEGELDAGGAFRSDRIIIRHTSEYRTEEPDRLELAEEEVCDR